MASHSVVTITQVAKAAGVSIGTVSRVLSSTDRSPRVSVETAERVRAIAHRMGYVVNPLASALRAGRSGFVGAVVRDIGDPFLTTLTAEVERLVRDRGGDLLVGHSQFDDSVAARQAAFISGGMFDGLLLIGSFAAVPAFVAQILARGVNCVMLASGHHERLPSVAIDETAATELGVDHLLALDHREIVFLGSLDLPGVDERRATFEAAIKGRLGSSVRPMVVDCPNTRSQAIEVARAVIGRDRPTAFFCASDNLALGTLAAAQIVGLEVPRDLSILGFDGIPEGELSVPPLSTVAQPITAMAALAVEALFRRMDDAEVSPGSPSAPSAALVNRGTTGPKLTIDHRVDGHL